MFLRQESAHGQVTREQVTYYLDERTNNVVDTVHNKSKIAEEANNSGVNIKQSKNDGVKLDANTSMRVHRISFHPCVVRAVGLLQLLYSVL